jgi:hypothetical protein
LIDLTKRQTRVNCAFEAFRQASPRFQAELMSQGGPMKIGLHQQDFLLATLGQGRSEVQANRGLSIVRKWAGDQDSLQRGGLSQSAQSHPEKPIAIGTWATWIGVKDEPGFGRDPGALDWHSEDAVASDVRLRVLQHVE